MTTVQDQINAADLVFIGTYVSHTQYEPTAETLEFYKNHDETTNPLPPLPMVHDGGQEYYPSAVAYLESVKLKVVKVLKGNTQQDTIGILTKTEEGRSNLDSTGAKDDVYRDASLFTNYPFVLVFAHTTHIERGNRISPNPDPDLGTRPSMKNRGFDSIEEALAYIENNQITSDSELRLSEAGVTDANAEAEGSERAVDATASNSPKKSLLERIAAFFSRLFKF